MSLHTQLTLVILVGIGVAPLARAQTYDVPIISISCHFNPSPSYPRKNGYDCTEVRSSATSKVSLNTNASELENTLRRSEALAELSRQTDAACGSTCRFFYGGWGHQCLAVAQGAYFTGLGSFLGRETTRRDAEATALRDCDKFVGNKGDKCRVLFSECATGIPQEISFN